MKQIDALFPVHIATKVREVFTDYSTFRAVRPFGKKDQQPELTFLAEWPTPARMIFMFVADTCFLCDHPYVYPFQQSFRSGRAATAVLEYSAVEEQWSKIKRLVAESKQDEKVVADVAGDAMMGASPDSAAKGDVVEADEVDPTSANEDIASRFVFWRKFAEETVRSCISLRPAPSTEDELTEMVKTCDAAKVTVVHGQSTVIKFYDEKLASEALSSPNIRKPPHRTNYFKSCIASGLAASNTGKCTHGEWYVVLDHGKNALQSTVNKAFAGLADYCQTYDILVDEESLIQRRGRRSKKVLKQSERMFVFAYDSQAIPDEKRKYYKGSSKGQSWGFISLTPYSHVWRVSVEQKKAAYADAMRPVGGKATKEDADSAGEEDVSAVEDTERLQDGVPFCYHGLPLTFFKELLHVSHGKGVIDFTPGDGNFAISVIECKGSVLYFGLCHTEVHCQLLRDYLSNYVLEAMQKEGNPLFNELCAAEMKTGKAVNVKKDDPDKDTDTKNKRKNTKNDDKKSKKKKKTRAKSSSSVASPNDSPDEDSSDD